MGCAPVPVLGLAKNNPHDSVVKPTRDLRGVVVIVTAAPFLLLPVCLSSCLFSCLNSGFNFDFATRINWKLKVKINRFNY